MLSDARRRREYDDLYASRPRDRTSEPDASANFFDSFAGMFGGASNASGQPPRGATGERPDADHVFADVFEEVRKRPSALKMALSINTTFTASAPRSAATCSVVGLAGCTLWCWPRLHHREHPRTYGRRVCWKPSGSYQRREGEECCRSIRTTWRQPEGRGMALKYCYWEESFLKTTFTLLRSYALLPPRFSVQPLVSSDDTPLSVLYDV